MTAFFRILLLSIILYSSANAKNKNEVGFFRIPALDNVSKSEHLIEVIYKSRKLECGVHCSDLSGQCWSFAWNSKTWECSLYSETFGSVPASRVPVSGVTENGWELFSKTVCKATVKNGVFRNNNIFEPGTIISGSCDEGYFSITGGITAFCDGNYHTTVSGACNKLITNAALMKPAAESTREVSDILPDVAVDGNRNTNFGGRSCSHTARGDRSPWWSVDLQNIYGIITVKMLNRIDYSDRLRDATITAGNTTSTINTYCGFFAGPGTSGQLVTVNCVPGVVGRFVRIQLRTEYLTLCEVDVLVIRL